MLKLGFIFGNIRGLYPKCNKTKIDQIYDISKLEGANILAITESHLSEDIKDCEVRMDGYDIHRSDRERTTHGGVIVYTKKELKAIKLCEWKNS